VPAVLIHDTIPLELHREQQLPLRRKPGETAGFIFPFLKICFSSEVIDKKAKDLWILFVFL
jgi:hypothetical protein